MNKNFFWETIYLDGGHWHRKTKNKNNKYKLNLTTLTWKNKPKENRLVVNMNLTLNEITILPPLYNDSTFLSQGHER